MPCPNDAVEIALEQCHAGTFHGNVSSGTHCDTDIGCSQSRRIVHPIAGHGDHTPLSTEPFDDFALILGEYFSLDVRDPEFGRHCLRRRGIIARQHDHANAGRLQGRNSRRRRGFDRIGNRNDASGLPVYRNEDRGRAVLAHIVGRRRQTCRIDASVRHDPPISDDQLAPFDGTGDAFTDRGVEMRDRGKRQSPVVG